MTDLDKLVFYRGIDMEQILKDMVSLIPFFENSGTADDAVSDMTDDVKDQAIICFYDCIHGLTDIAGEYGFEGNLWHDYLTLLLVSNENEFSISCEITGDVSGSFLKFAKHDFCIFMRLFNLDLKKAEEVFQSGLADEIIHCKRGSAKGKIFNPRISEAICTLSLSLAEASASMDIELFTGYMVDFYRNFGVGKYGLHKAFRVEHGTEGVQIVPIANIADVRLDDLVGLEIQKKKLIDNTEAFVEGKRANNCLLFGDAGTGKSTSIKGILNMYYDRGLRMIEIYKHQFQDLNAVIDQIKNRNYRFIIYMDDLSFEEYEVEYKYLKAVIEGGLERRPDNVLIYATSNRRHLIRERVSDNAEDDIRMPGRSATSHGGDLHISDTVQEKLSLSSRFGVTIYFGSPDQKEFKNIVLTLAKRNGVDMPEDELLYEANKWELSHGGLSGRTAQQFVDYLLGLQQM